MAAKKTKGGEWVQNWKEKYESLRNEQQVQPFVDELLKNIGVLLMVTPMNEWPDVAKAAFKAASKDMPTLAHLYIEIHDKK
jgi:hypothetical protein